MKRLSLREFVALGVLAVLSAAPTPGDIGGCGQPVEDLDPGLFFEDKAFVDCRECTTCGFQTQACTIACKDQPRTQFPEGCAPLAHDGEVCLRALDAASCATYSSYISDDAPTSPSECQFCPEPH